MTLPTGTTVPRILIVSVRAFKSQAANTSLYELEDFLCRELGADLYTPSSEFDVPRKVYRSVRYASGSNRLAAAVSRFPTELAPERDYDLALVVLDNAWQTHLIESVRGWRERCRIKACYISEMWPVALDNWRLRAEPFDNYDVLYTGVRPTAAKLAQLTGKPCHHVARAVDVDRFDPFPDAPERVVDAAYVGRRDPHLHDALLSWSDRERRFYHYDTVRAQKVFVDDPGQHRRMYAELLKRTRYTFAFPAKFDLHSETGGQQEIGGRYYEFTAAGTIVIGGRVAAPHFAEDFGWEDVVIDFDPTRDDIAAVIAALDADPERRRRIALRNVAGALRRHDSVHRVRDMLEQAGFGRIEALERRVEALRRRAEALEAML